MKNDMQHIKPYLQFSAKNTNTA